MRNLLQFQRLLAIAVGLWLLGAPAAALIIAVDDRAGLTFRAQDVPKEIAHGSYSCFIWLHPEQTHDRRRRLYSIPGGVKITLEPGSGVRATLLTTGFEATAPATLAPDRWALIAVSRDRATGRLDVWAGSDGSALEHGWFEPRAAAPGLGPADPLNLPPPEPWRLGAWGAEPGTAGAFGLVVLRIHAVGDADVREIWNSRRLFAPYDHDNRAAGGRMTGWSGGIHVVGHAITTSPIDGGAGGTPPEQAALVGGPVTEHNLHIINFPTRTSGPYWFGFRTVRPIDEVSGMMYGSRLEPEYEGFFVRDIPVAAAPAAPAGAAREKVRQLATGPEVALRIMTSANSRGIRGQAHDVWPQNYMHGFVQLNLPHISGVMLMGASLRPTEGRWLGFDTSERPLWSLVDPVDIAVSPRADFSRFFTASGTSRGGGSGVLIRPGGFHRLRCGPVEGTLIRAEAPLISEAHILRFPGSSDLLWRPDRGASQGAEGQRSGSPRRVALDTTRLVHTMAGADRLVADGVLALGGDLTGAIAVGDACFIAGGPGAESISVVAEVAFDGVETIITFEHPFGGAPGAGSTLHFGAWGFHTVWYPWSGVATGDPDTWRGLELAADELGPGSGVVAVAMSAYRADVAGFILGAAGWGGNGYDLQLQSSFSAAPERWMAMSGADVWIQGFAQQGSTPGSMDRYAEAIRRGLPEVEIVWAGDTEHGNGTFETWHTHILTVARSMDITALSLLMEPTSGTFLEQLADGLRADTAHYSAYGNLVLARGWTKQIEIAAQCGRVDLDGDGELTFFDFLEFSALYSAGDLRADFDQDGSLTFFDFLAFQEQMAACSG